MEIRILGALGSGTLGPLLAERIDAERSPQRVVLDRPSPPGMEASAGLPGVVLEWQKLRIPAPDGGDRLVGMRRDVPGWDLHDALEAGLSPGGAQAVLDRAAGVLRAAHAAGLAHGAVRGSALRIGASGEVLWVGWRGGEPSADEAALAELREELELDGARARPDELHTWLLDAQPVLRVHPHELSELRIPLPAGGSGPGPTPRQRVASIAALTLVLGLAAGWLLSSEGPEPVVLKLHAEAERCELEVQQGGGTLHRELSAGEPSLDCRLNGGELSCASP